MARYRDMTYLLGRSHQPQGGFPGSRGGKLHCLATNSATSACWSTTVQPVHQRWVALNGDPPYRAFLPDACASSRRLQLALRSKRQSEPDQDFTIKTLQWAWSLMRSAVSPSRRPHNSEWSLWPTTIRS